MPLLYTKICPVSTATQKASLCDPMLLTLKISYRDLKLSSGLLWLNLDFKIVTQILFLITLQLNNLF